MSHDLVAWERSIISSWFGQYVSIMSLRNSSTCNQSRKTGAPDSNFSAAAGTIQMLWSLATTNFGALWQQIASL